MRYVIKKNLKNIVKFIFMLVKRSKWKLPYISSIFFKKRFLKNAQFLIQKRNSIIPKKFLGKRFKIHNGQWYKSKDIINDVIGYKYGEFSFTRAIDRQIATKLVRKKKGKKN